WLLVGKLVVVFNLLLEAVQFGFKLRDEFMLVRVVVNIAQFVWIPYEVIKFPLVLFPEVNQFVRRGADAVVGAGVMVALVVIVPVVIAGPPTSREVPFQQGHEAFALHFG